MRKTFLPNTTLAPRHALKLRSHTPRFWPTSVRTTTITPCRTLAQVRSDREVFPEVWFTSTSPTLRNPESFNTPPPQDPPPPDERTLKLGKSTFPHQYLEPLYSIANNPQSPSYTPEPPSHPPRNPTTTLYPLTTNNTPPLSLHPPTPSNRQRPCRLPRRSLDRTNGLGSRPHRRKRPPHNPLRAHHQKRQHLHHNQPRKISRPLADLRQDAGKGHGGIL